MVFPIPSDPPEGGTGDYIVVNFFIPVTSFQFLVIPPKGEPELTINGQHFTTGQVFPIPSDPPEGGTKIKPTQIKVCSDVSNS